MEPVGADSPAAPSPRVASNVSPFPPRSFRFIEQFAADQPAPDLGRSCTYLVELGVAQQPPGGRIVNVAHAAQALDGLERHAGRLFSCKQDRTGGILARDLAVVAC